MQTLTRTTCALLIRSAKLKKSLVFDPEKVTFLIISSEHKASYKHPGSNSLAPL